MISIKEKLNVSHTPIKTMELPAGWFEDFEATNIPGTARSRRFHSTLAPTAEIFTYESGAPVDALSMVAFTDLLAGSPNVILPAKMERIQNVLGNMSNPEAFKVLMIYTQRLGGKNVLTVEGRWTSSEEDVYALFMPAQADSRYIFELHYQAAKNDFRKTFPEVKASLSTIKWQEN